VAAANALAPILGKDPSTLQTKLTGKRRFVYVARGITPEAWEKVKALGLAGILSQSTSRRTYPSGQLAANVVGFVGGEGKGLGGLEYGMQTELGGQDGHIAYEVAGGGRRIATGQEQGTQAVAGSDVTLTIDRDIQWQAQQAIAARVAAANADGGTVVVMDPHTGKIFALASAPTFDPNTPGLATDLQRNNLAVTEAFEPGSTSKVMTMAAVLEEKKLRPNSHVTVPSTLTRHMKVFHDHDNHPTENLTLTGVLAKSSNIGTILAAEKLTPEVLYSYLKSFGVGERSGLKFPGEAKGFLPVPSSWSGTSMPTIAFGQGISVNSVQAASVYATVANNGVRVTPSLVASTTDANGTVHVAPAPQTRRVISATTATTLRAMMETVVSDQGTAAIAKIPGYRVAGKTATAQRYEPKCKCYKGYVASFIGMAPADNPALVVAVTLINPRNGHYGGAEAGPVFKSVMSFALQSLRIPPTSTKPPVMPLSW
jgi:cell division protein FtsI (penicillin-binding protein 3)